jgi:hypothetical protein
MTKESMKAWKRMQDWGYEINLCIQHQYPYRKDYTDDEMIDFLNVFNIILDERIKEWNEEE